MRASKPACQIWHSFLLLMFPWPVSIAIVPLLAPIYGSWKRIQCVLMFAALPPHPKSVWPTLSTLGLMLPSDGLETTHTHARARPHARTLTHAASGIPQPPTYRTHMYRQSRMAMAAGAHGGLCIHAWPDEGCALYIPVFNRRVGTRKSVKLERTKRPTGLIRPTR